MSDQVAPFRIAATNEQLEDLKRRLRATRWPERECVEDWSQGLPVATQNLVRTPGDSKGGPDSADHVRVFFALC